MKTNRNTDLQCFGACECIEHNSIALRVGIASDQDSHELKDKLVAALDSAGHDVIEFGSFGRVNHDDYTEFIVPMAKCVASGELAKGIAICSSGVRATIVANKVPGVRAAFITESFSAHQGVEEDAMNVMCLGSQVTGQALASELVQIFLRAQFKQEAIFRERLADRTSIERNPHSLQKYTRTP